MRIFTPWKLASVISQDVCVFACVCFFPESLFTNIVLGLIFSSYFKMPNIKRTHQQNSGEF